ncbi:MAG: Clp protease N-terminal domain-containing protein [Candidatus Obscuribacterales bacterium]|nr:Clp protease N-terminal domain-containing protein [Candidatus Obscuribacterales bacterium]
MFEKYSSSAIKVIMLAQHETVRLGHDRVGTAELLLGLIGEQTGLAVEVLDAVGVTISVARNEVERIVGFGQCPPRIEIPFTAQAQHVLELAWLAAKELHSKTVDTEHLLLGLLRQNDADVVAVLSGMNLELNFIENRLLDEIASNSEILNNDGLEPFAHSDNFTQSAMRALKRAKSESRQLKAESIDTANILSGLCSDRQSVAKKLLVEAGVSLTGVRESLLKRSESESAISKSEYSAPAKAALENAWSEAQNRFSNYVAAEHLLSALLKQQDTAAMAVLRDLEIDLDVLTKRLEAALKKTSSEQAVLKRAEPTLTEDVLATLVFANEEARKLNHKRTGVEHVLCGLILQNGLAKQALEKSGVDYEKAVGVVRQMHQNQVSEPKIKPVLSKLLDTILVLFRQRPFTSEAENLMSQAMKMTQDRDDLFVDSGHVLLALIAISNHPNNVLAQLGIDKKALLTHTVDLMESR